jgi:uncharacterized membrane protein
MLGSALSRRDLLAGSSALAASLIAANVARAQSPEEAAGQRAVEISQLEAARDFDGLYNLLHPDAQAFIAREVVVGWYAEFLGSLSVEALTVTGVQIIPWTWPVTGVTYPETAEVSFVQPYIENGTRTDVSDVVRLVDPGDGGGYRWFFGRSREFVDEQIARFGGQAPAVTDPATQPVVTETATEPAGGTGEYELTELGVLPGFDLSTARVLNNNRIVAGDSSPFGEPGDCGFVWRDGEMAALHELTGQPDWLNYTRDINEEGAIVGGSAPFEGDFTAYLVHGSVYTDLGSLPDRTSTSANGINNDGVIVGWSASHYTQYETGFYPKAVVWRGGESEMLDDAGATSSHALGINADGAIIGTADWGAGQQAVIWTDDSVSPLPMHPDGETGASAEAINADGTVVGFSYLTAPGPGPGGAPWSWQIGDDALTLLPLPNGITSVGSLSINDAGIITGTGYGADQEVGLIWRDGGVELLNDLIDTGSGWSINAAADINDQNDIAGQATSLTDPRTQVAVLLTLRETE